MAKKKADGSVTIIGEPATDVMRQIEERFNKAMRGVRLAMAWQYRERWLTCFRAAEAWRYEERQADDQEDSAHQVRLVFPDEVGRHKERANQHRERAEHAREFVVAAERELEEVRFLLREFNPGLLELVPHVDFNQSPSDVDLTGWLNAMGKIEGAFRVIQNEGMEGLEKMVAKSQAIAPLEGADKTKCPRINLPKDSMTRDLIIELDEGTAAGKSIEEINRVFMAKHKVPRALVASIKRGARRYRQQR